MPTQVLYCSACHAPLPDGGPQIECPFCGALNQQLETLTTERIRAAVQQGLAERAMAGELPPRRSSPWLGLAVLGLVFGLGGLAAARLLLAPSPRSTAPALLTPRPTLPSVPERLPPPRPHPRGLGLPAAMALGAGDELYLVTPAAVSKLDRGLTKLAWSTPFALPRQDLAALAVVGDRLALADSDGIAFFDVRSGEKTGTYLLQHQGFEVSVCAAGADQVLMQTVFDGTLRFDVHTAAPATGKGQCQPMTDLRCDPSERCGFASLRLGGLSCRYHLQHGAQQVTFCEADGTKQLLLVEHSGATVRWKTPRGPGSTTNPAFATVIDGVLVTGDGHLLEAFDEASGTRRWSHPLGGVARAVLGDGQRLYLGDADTVMSVSLETGEELARFRPAD